MLSKVLPWLFLEKYPHVLAPSAKGIHAFLIEDSYLERLVLDQLKKHEKSYPTYSGSEVSRDFIEEHFLNLSFLNLDGESLKVLNAENISLENAEFLLENSIDWENNLLILFFSKSTKAFTFLSKNKNKNIDSDCECVEIELPRFWEGPKLWQFCQKMYGVQLDASVTRFVLTNLEHNFESFTNVIESININFPNGKVNLLELEELFKKSRWDFFELIDLFHKGPQFFLEEVLKKDLDFDWLRSLSSFMQAHLIKILFPEEILKKAKLSKYDQSILDLSRKENREKLQYFLKFFCDLEILAKSQDQLILNFIRREFLNIAFF